MTEEKKEVKDEKKEKVIIKEESKTGDAPKEIPLQKLVWLEIPQPIVHVARGYVIKIDDKFLYFQGDKKDAPLIIPVSNVKEIK